MRGEGTAPVSDQLAEMSGAVESAGERVHGGNPVSDVAQEWIDAGLTVAQAEAYIEAGCWDADRVAALVGAGIEPEHLTDDDVNAEIIKARDWASRQRGGNGWTAEDWSDSIAYLHSNGDVSTEEIAAAVKSVSQ